MTKLKVLLLILFIFRSSLFSQSTGSIRGFVSDSLSGEPLAFANVFVKELSRGTSTDTKGYFFLTGISPSKSYNIAVSYVGYQTKTVSVSIEPDKMTALKILLISLPVEIGTVEKVGEKIAESNATDLGLIKISIKDYERFPHSVEMDVFRTLKSFTGVQSSGDVSANFSVRGSPSSQNLILLNDATIYYPFHAIGLFSSIDPEMVSNIEFYKGGFPSEYSGRLASVIRINTKSGNKNSFGGSAGGSLLSGKILLEGPSPNGSFIVTARHSYNNKILKNFINDDIPVSFYDASFKVDFANDNFLRNGKLSLFGYVSNDQLKYNDIKRADYKWSNKLISLKWLQLSDSPLFWEIDFYISLFDAETFPNQSGLRSKKNSLKDSSLKMNFKYIYDSKDELNFGLNIQEVSADFFLQNINGGIKNAGGPRGTSFSLFGKFKFLRYENFGVDLGSRFNLTRITPGKAGDYFFEPRLSITYRPHPLFAIKAAWGVFLQEMVTLADENDLNLVYEPWFTAQPNLDPIKAIHYMAGLSWDATDKLKVEFETYYKDLINFASLNDQKFVDSDPDLINASGESYGAELSLKYIEENLRFSSGYTLSWSNKEVRNESFPARYDSRHILNLSLEYNLGNNWSSTIEWSYFSGLPYTRILRYESKLIISDPFSGNEVFQNYHWFPEFGNTNDSRLPDYHRLDFSLSKKISINSLNVFFNFSIINIYNRKNFYYYDSQNNNRVNMLPFLPSASIKVAF